MIGGDLGPTRGRPGGRRGNRRQGRRSVTPDPATVSAPSLADVTGMEISVAIASTRLVD